MAKDQQASQATGLDVDEVSLLLIGSEKEQNDAITLIDKHLRRVIFGVIRQAGLSLSAEDIEDVYQEVLLGIWRAAREKRYDADKPLLPFVFTVARRKSFDRIRKKSGGVRKEQVLDSINERLADTRVGEAWRAVAAKHDGQRMMELFRNAIVRMPVRQRLVASVMIDRFPEEPSLQEIQEEVHRRTGEHLTVVAVKSARREARRKIAEQMVRAGYMEREDHGDTE